MVSRTRLALILILLSLFTAIAADTPASILRRFYPTQPQPGVTDLVRLEVEIRADSTVGTIALIDPPTPLDSIAVEAVHNFLFAPATRDSLPVDSRLMVEVVFLPFPKARTIADSLHTREYLQTEVDRRIGLLQTRYRNRYEATPDYLFHENFHLYDPAGDRFLLLSDGIPVRSRVVTPAHLIQTFTPFDSVAADGHFIRSVSEPYDIEPAFTEAVMGLGDYSMSNVAVSFRKGAMFGRQGLDLRFDYVGYDGDWAAERETSSDFHGRVSYRTGRHEWVYDLRSIRQEIAAEALAAGYRPDSTGYVREDLSRHRLHWKNPWVDLGFTLETDRYRYLAPGTINDTRSGLFLHRNLDLGPATLSGTVVLSRDRVPEYLFESGYRTGTFTYRLTADYAGTDDWRAGSDNRLRLTESLGAVLRGEVGRIANPSDSLTRKRSVMRFPAGLDWSSGGLSAEACLVPGADTDPDHTGDRVDFLDFEGSGRFNLPVPVGSLHARVDATRCGLLNGPHDDGIRVDASLYLAWDLHYHNAWLLGARVLHIQGATRTDGRVEDDNTALDLWSGFEITRSFAIHLEAYNVLGKARFADRPYPDTHYNVTVHWLFVN